MVKGEKMASQQATGYIRVSTAGQVEDGVSIEAQTKRIEAWCLANDVELSEVFSDEGISGKRADNRPQLQRALESVKRSGGVLVVYSLSRLARSTKDTIEIGESLEAAGADLVSLSEKIDTTTAAGKMVFRMLAVMAEFERDLVSERTTLAMAHKRSNNERIGKVPYGFDLLSDGTTLVENAEEQKVIGLISSLRMDGYSLRRIAAELSRRSVQTKSGADKWTHSSVQRIVTRIAA